jgi:hypothetical protein
MAQADAGAFAASSSEELPGSGSAALSHALQRNPLSEYEAISVNHRCCPLSFAFGREFDNQHFPHKACRNICKEMATIVYEGTGSGGGGDLFKGMKFYFLRRVPLRTKWEELVLVRFLYLRFSQLLISRQSNGGELVKLEKQADIVIADHARKDNPAGAISWKYVEESVKKGELEDIEDHRAGPVTHTAREVGSGGPTRKGRTPFTAEDDRILMEWVMKGERAGIAVKGNELFQQLEEKVLIHLSYYGGARS